MNGRQGSEFLISPPGQKERYNLCTKELVDMDGQLPGLPDFLYMRFPNIKKVLETKNNCIEDFSPDLPQPSVGTHQTSARSTECRAAGGCNMGKNDSSEISDCLINPVPHFHFRAEEWLHPSIIVEIYNIGKIEGSDQRISLTAQQPLVQSLTL